MTASIYQKDVFVEGYSGTNTVVVSGYVKRGSGKGLVQMHLTPEDILNMARLILLAGKSKGPGQGWNVGHAIYHRRADGQTRPDIECPCSSCDPDAEFVEVAEALGKILDTNPR